MATIHDRDPHDASDYSRRIERALRQEERIEPSSDFSLQVMAAVRQEAALPPPIAFPWRRALPGIAACAVLIAAGGVMLLRSAAQLRLAPPPPAWFHLPALEPSALLTSEAGALVLTVAALAGSYLLTRLARHLVHA
jgi:hypothetical protein